MGTESRIKHYSLLWPVSFEEHSTCSAWLETCHLYLMRNGAIRMGGISTWGVFFNFHTCLYLIQSGALINTTCQYMMTHYIYDGYFYMYRYIQSQSFVCPKYGNFCGSKIKIQLWKKNLVTVQHCSVLANGVFFFWYFIQHGTGSIIITIQNNNKGK